MNVSIITVCYNSEKTITETMQSVLDQTYLPSEYIIIDGNSTDKTIKIINTFKSKFEEKKINFIIKSEPDKGIYDAMNKGILIATGDIIGIINSDDKYLKNALFEVVKEYTNKSFDVFYADLKVVTSTGRQIVKKSKFRKYITTRDWNHPTTFITKNVYNTFLYDTSYKLYADFDLILRLRNANLRFVVCNKILAEYYFGGLGSRASIKDCVCRIKERFRLFLSNGYSRVYLFEIVMMEIAKYILTILYKRN